MCRDHRCLIACQKQHRENEPAGQVDIPTRVESMSGILCAGTTDVSLGDPACQVDDTTKV